MVLTVNKTAKGEIPIHQPFLKKDNSKSQNANTNNNQKEWFRKPELHTLIDIELNLSQSRERLCVMLIFLLVWLPILVYIFWSHGEMKASALQEREQLIVLKAKISDLDLQIKLLKDQLDSTAWKSFYNSDNDSSDNDLSSGNRPKRELNQELSNGMDPLSVKEQKESDSGQKQAAIKAVHLKGVHPEPVIDNGVVGPWFNDAKILENDQVSFSVRERGGSVEVREPGLYFIYAQVYYLTSNVLNSFSINVRPENSKSPVPIAFCSTNISSAGITSEVSCYTGVVRALQKGDRISIQQRERHRRLIMRAGHTFLGLAKLSDSFSFNRTVT